MRKILHTITPILCVVILLTGCSKKDDVEPDAVKPPLLQTGATSPLVWSIVHNYKFTRAYIDYTLSGGGLASPEHYVSLMKLSAFGNSYASGTLSLNMVTAEPSLKAPFSILFQAEIDAVYTYYPAPWSRPWPATNRINVRNRMGSDSWIAVVDADQTQETNKMTILFYFQENGSSGAIYSGKLFLE